MRQLLTGLAAAALLVAAGCGGGSESAAGTESAASIAPVTTALYASIDTNLDSDQWERLEQLVNEFPGRDKLVGAIERALAEEDIEVERDLKPALGPTIEIVVPSFENGGSDVVGLTHPKDEDEFRALLAKSDDPVVVRELEGWTAFADSAQALDRFEAARGDRSLADSDRFQDAMAELPEDALAKLYVDGEQAAGVAKSLSPASIASAYGSPVYVSAALEAESDGLRVVGAARTEGSTIAAPDLKLLEEVPAGTIAFVNFHGYGGQLGVTKKLRDVPGVSSAVEQVERLLGVTLDDVSTLFNEEAVLYVRRALLIPEVTLLLEVKDRARALETLDALAARATAIGAEPPEERVVGDVRAKRVDLGRFAVLYGAFDERVVVTTSESGIRALREGGDKLVDDDAYTRSRDAAGVADEEVVLWLELDQTADLIEQVAALSGEDVPPELAANLRPLRSLLVAGHHAGDGATFRLFLEVE